MQRILFVFTLLALVCNTASFAAEKPNIIFIMVDDMGYHDLGCFGSKTIQTPRIDAMAKEGIRFTDCYSGDTVCAPARSVLMTGLHKGHTPVRGNSGGIPLFPEDVTVAEVLKKAGYATGGFGKWGLGNQGKPGAAENQGFDVFCGYYNQWHAHDYYRHLFRNSKKINEEKRYTHYVIFEDTLKFIRENKDKPFFCYCPWTPPHAAYQIPETDPAWQLYKDKPWEGSAKVAAAMDTMMDTNVGQILDLLKELKLEEKTIIFFCSDNGAAKRFDGIHNSCGEMQGHKRSFYEGGIRVPMVVRWKGTIKPGQVSAFPWYFADVMPTLAALAGVTKEMPKKVDGISIVPTLLGKGKQEKRDYMYWNVGAAVVRSGNWKGIRSKSKKMMLFDLSKDIGEKNDLAAEQPELVAKMHKWMDEANEPARSQKDDGKYTGADPGAKKKKKK